MRNVLRFGAASVLVAALGVTVPAVTTAPASGDTRAIPSGGTTSIRSTGSGPDRLQQPEIRTGREEEGGADSNRPRPDFDHGLFPKHPLEAPHVRSSRVVRGEDWDASVDGLTHRDTRLANGGNQFSLEPPDQALCVGNGFVVEAVNSAIQVRSSAAGAPVTGVRDLNTFFGYPAAIDRATGAIGPQVIDPVCLYDPDNNRFVVALTTLGSNPDGSFTGKNTIDVAVSNTDNPTGAWTIYSVPAQNDGTDGTPDHGCKLEDDVTHGPCFQDYPHLGADANGIYISTNEYDLFGPGFNAAQVFAFSKDELARHPATIRMTLVENLRLLGTPGWTVWPATSPAGEYSTDAGGTEFLLSTVAGDGSETGNPTGTARRLGLWAITNTSSLDTATPALSISSRKANSQTYVFPPTSNQKAGDIPLGECVNDTTLVVETFGPGCWNAFFDVEPAHDEVESSPDSLDSRMQQTWFVDGTLWGASGTAVRVDGDLQAGIAWFALRPTVNDEGRLRGKVVREDYLALDDNNLTMPALTMTPGGRGAIAFTVLGEDHFPSAGYVRITDSGRVGPIHLAARGLGPDDGFTSYKAFVDDPPRTRWGDYGAAVTDGEDIWLASEYIGQTCTLAEYFPSPPSLTGFGSCNNTRTSLGNWYTRITKLG